MRIEGKSGKVTCFFLLAPHHLEMGNLLNQHYVHVLFSALFDFQSLKIDLMEINLVFSCAEKCIRNLLFSLLRLKRNLKSGISKQNSLINVAIY